MSSQPLAYTLKVSVIVPVWNPGPGISRCVESLRGQTLEDIEMIFVDDCGTDNAMDVVRAAAKEDPRIRILENSENLGTGISRNKGIEMARGEYLSFVDADDYVDLDFLEVLYHKGKAEDLDIVKGFHICEFEDGKVVLRSHQLNYRIRKGLLNNMPLFYLFTYEFQSALYHSRLFAKSDVRFGLSSNGEDTTFLLKACHVARSFGADDLVAYHYLYRSESALNTMTEANLEGLVLTLRDKAAYLIGHVEPNPYAGRYLVDRLKYYLTIQIHANQTAGMEEAASQFLASLRNIALDYPAIESMKVTDLVVFALAEYGEVLTEWPYCSFREIAQHEAYMGIIEKWIGFLASHPEHHNIWSRVVILAARFAEKMVEDDIPQDKIEIYKSQIRDMFRHFTTKTRNVSKKIGKGKELKNYANYQLSLCNQIMAEGKKDVAGRKLQVLEWMLRLTPEIQAWAEHSLTVEIRAILDHGLVLRTRLWGDFREAKNYLQMVQNWHEFFMSYPDCNGRYLEGYENFLEDMSRAIAEMERKGEPAESLARCREVVRVGWQELPLRIRVKKMETRFEKPVTIIMQKVKKSIKRLLKKVKNNG